MDKTFSALSADDEVLRIDSLTVDLGRFTRYLDEDRLLRELPDQLSRAVELAIQQGQAQLYRSPKQASAPVNQANSLKPQTTDVAFGDDELSETDWWDQNDTEFDESEAEWGMDAAQFAQLSQQYGNNPVDDVENQASTNDSLDPSQNDASSLICFLCTGHLSWWSDALGADEITRLFEQLTAEDGADLVCLLQDQPSALIRLSFQTDARLQSKLIDFLAPLGYELSVLRFANACHYAVASQALTAPDFVPRSIAPFVHLAWQGFMSWLSYAPSAEVSLAHLLEHWAQLPEFDRWQHAILASLSVPNTALSLVTYQPFIVQLRQTSAIQQDLVPVQPPEECIPVIAEVPGMQIRLNDNLLIDNAGLFLVFAELPCLFADLGWMIDDRFKNSLVQQLAIHLVAYLVHADESYSEPQLSLNKLLCGLQPDDPVWGDCCLSEHEKACAEQLLVQVIHNFDPDGEPDTQVFREHFIQRRGLLSVRDAAWLLRIEPEGRDLLLQQHFSPLSTLCYPWMPIPLVIEWRGNDG